MRVMVTGGRDFHDAKAVLDALEGLKPPATVIIHGGAAGLDSLADATANRLGIDRIVFPANWKKHGNCAGPVRNIQMLTQAKPELVLAFPGGRGTAHAVREAQRLGIPVLRYEERRTE